MLVTEEEARDKYCCQQLDNAEPGESYCLGSQCMAWRWVDLTEKQVLYGYCGLAGKPE